MRRLRSLAIGDCEHYVSPYMIGVKGAMERLGHQHVEVSIRSSAELIQKAVDELRPDVVCAAAD
jgi:hypothetical protein